jgi:hypothetical protein
VNGTSIWELEAPENKFVLHKEIFIVDQKSVWTGTFIARNKYGLNIPFLLKSTPVLVDFHAKNRVFVLRENVYVR